MASDGLYRIVLADDHVLYRSQLKRLLMDSGEFEVVGEASDGVELLVVLLKDGSPPDMVITDISMPRLEGIETTAIIKRTYPGTKVLILSMHRAAAYVREAFAAGANGYLLKEDAEDELFPAIEQIKAGGTYLSTLLNGADKP